MSRREEIKKASNELSNSCSKTFRMGFEVGAMWADNNPKIHWINVSKDLPCNHSKLINGSSTVEVLAACKDGYISSTYMIKGLKEWIWFDFKPDYWMIPPKLPKE